MIVEREGVGRVVPDGVFLDGGDDARGNADHERNHYGHRAKLNCHRQLLQNEVENRNVNSHRLSEVAGEHALNPVEILDGNRPIEVILLANLLDHGRVALFAGHDQGGVARQQLLQREDDHRHEEQGRDQLQQTFAKEIQHGGRRFADWVASLT